MPFVLRKAPRRELYWVVTKATGKKHSIEPLPLKRAEAQMRSLYARETPLRRGGDEPEEEPVVIEASKSAPSFPQVVLEPQPYVSFDDVEDAKYGGDGLFDTFKKLKNTITNVSTGLKKGKDYLKTGLEDTKKGNFDKLTKLGSVLSLGKQLAKESGISGGSYYPEQYETYPITIRKPTGWKSPAILKLTERRAIELSKLDEATRRALGFSSRGDII